MTGSCPACANAAEEFQGVLYNDFSNMNGGMFPPHGKKTTSTGYEYTTGTDHAKGTGVDVKFGPTFTVDDHLAENLILKQLDSAAGQHVQRMLITMQGTLFESAVKGVTLCDGRLAAVTDGQNGVVQNYAGHGDHFHWTIKPQLPPKTFSCRSDLALDGEADRRTIDPGEELTFSFTVQNTLASNPGTKTVLTVKFDPDLEYVPGSAAIERQLLDNGKQPKFDAQTHSLEVDLGTILGAGSQHDVTVKVKMRAKSTAAGKEAKAIAELRHGESDPQPANNQVVVSVTIRGETLIEVTPTSGLQTTEVGGTATSKSFSSDNRLRMW